jgi:V8-like Glu-specific endopeptidase
VADVLSSAYATAAAARAVALQAGIEPEDGDLAGPARDVWVRILQRAAAASLVLELAAVALHDPASTEFHVPLQQLLGDRLGEVEGRIASRWGLAPAPTTGPDEVVRRIVESAPAGAPGGVLNAVTSVGAGFVDPRARIQAVTDLIARTVLIEVANEPKGTGFLIGDDLVLTAAHVLDPLSWPPRPQRPVRVVFDHYFSEARPTSPAETGIPVPVSELVTGSLPTPQEVRGGAEDDWDAPAGRLDYALLKLPTPAPPREGEPRGHYPLSDDPYPFGADAIYMIMQHPLGGFLQLSEFSARTEVNPGGTRIRYLGNTQPGSSGSPVVDARGRLVAIHHFSTAKRNQGIPISKVASDLLTGTHAGLFRAGAPTANSAALATVDPFAANAVLTVRPFVNRRNLRETMREMAEQPAGTRTLAIQGESGTGVSYSYFFAMHVASQSTLCPGLLKVAPGGLRALRVDLRKYVNVPVERVRAEIGTRLLLDLGIIETPKDPLAQDARETLLLVATIGAKLRSSAQQWWLFFDSIDSLVAVKQGEVDELIHGLIDLAEENIDVPLRIVLAGRQAEQFAADHTDWAERDGLTGLTRGDVEAWLSRRAEEDSLTIDPARLAAKLAELFPSPGPQPEPRVLGPRLPHVLSEVLVP